MHSDPSLKISMSGNPVHVSKLESFLLEKRAEELF